MIVRIMEEDQYRLDDGSATEFERLDHALHDAVLAGDQAQFLTTMRSLLAFVRTHGQKVPHTEIVPSDIVVPAEDMTLGEARQYLEETPAG